MSFSFDTLINAIVPPIKESQAANLITKQYIEAKNPKGLFVLLPPWRSRLDHQVLARKEIIKKGYSCLEYKFPSSILSSNYLKTKEDFEQIKVTVREDLEKLKKENNFNEINIIGTSIGCVEALMIANHNPIINKIFLIVPGNSLAESMWNGIRTQGLKNTMIEKGISLDFLKEQWSNLAPENNTAGLVGKKIAVFLSHSDRVIPYELGKALVNTLGNKGLNPAVKENRFLGHYGTILNFSLNPGQFIDIL